MPRALSALLVRLALACGLCAATLPAAAALDIPNVPPTVSSSVDPNIMFLLDDSGSMQGEILPDSAIPSIDIGFFSSRKLAVGFLFPQVSNPYGESSDGESSYDDSFIPFDDGEDANVTLRSPTRNKLFYDPAITYQPWRKADGSSYGNVDPENAPYDPAGRNDCKINLKTGKMTGSSCSDDDISYPITFYVYDGSGDVTDRKNYIRYQYHDDKFHQWQVGNNLNTEKALTTLPWGRSVADEVQNFANWFSYHRSRILAVQAGVTQAFAELDPAYRVGFCTINHCNSSKAEPIIPIPHAKFTGDPKDDFFDEVINVHIPKQGTPLRSALDWAGTYYEKKEDTGPWGPKVTVKGEQKQLSCRQSFTILTTDGYWNDSFSGAGNADNNSGSEIKSADGSKSYTYSPAAPFKDDYSNTLADVAMTYWKKDLRPDLPNNVPTATADLKLCNANSLDPTFPDPAFWQHMTTFTLSLGVSGTLPRTTDTVTKLCNSAESWPNPTSQNEAKIDDLWHAAINGHGKFFAAQNPNEFAQGLKEALGAIATTKSSASNVAVNTNSITTGTLAFYARYYPNDWYGELLAYPVTAEGIGQTEKWSATIPAVDSRKLFTWNGSSGSTFEWTSLTPAQKTALGSQDIVNYLRGDQSKEVQNNGTFRNRKSLLGDIIHSSPVYVDNMQDGASRAQTVFVGANDGMLHAFDATNGQEIFAYVPSAVITPTLATLADPSYTHRYFVDGPIAVSDWSLTPEKNLLVGSLGYGGKGLFGLDVTNPKSFSAADVKWEFSGDDNSADLLGLVTGELLLAKLNDGKKAVIFGNGYNSTSQRAALFILELETGKLIKAIDTGAGSNDAPNGLAPPRGWDSDGNGTIDYVYAGDLHGNFWKFDLSHTNPTQWDVALKKGNTPQALFQARDKNNKAQPITARASIGINPSDSSLWVFFGTGRYLTADDVSDTSTQSWYGIIDDGTKNPVERSQLKARKIVARGTDPNTGNLVRAFEQATNGDMADKKGWYVDLDPGERIVSSSQFYGTVLVASSIIPSDDPCEPGGRGYVNAIDPFTGTALPFFLQYGTLKVGGQNIPVGSIDLGIGMPGQPQIVGDQLIVGGSAGETASTQVDLPHIHPHRVNWRELIRE